MKVHFQIRLYEALCIQKEYYLPPYCIQSSQIGESDVRRSDSSPFLIRKPASSHPEIYLLNFFINVKFNYHLVI